MEVLSILPVDRITTIVIRALAVFIFALFVLRVLGKRHLGHLTYLDILIIIALGSAVGDVMIYEESTAQFFASIIAIGTVGIAVKIIVELSSHFRWFNILLIGSPKLIIDDGEVIPKALAEEDVTIDEILTILREKGIDSIDSVYRMYIEPDGDYSIVLEQKKKRKKRGILGGL